MGYGIHHVVDVGLSGVCVCAVVVVLPLNAWKGGTPWLISLFPVRPCERKKKNHDPIIMLGHSYHGHIYHDAHACFITLVRKYPLQMTLPAFTSTNGIFGSIWLSAP